ncbi:hypothetical protein [Micromonospora lupini]
MPSTATLPGAGDVMVYGVVPGSTDTFMVDVAMIVWRRRCGPGAT